MKNTSKCALVPYFQGNKKRKSFILHMQLWNAASLTIERNEPEVTTNTHEELKPDVDTVHKEAEPLRTVNDIIDFYTNRKSQFSKENRSWQQVQQLNDAVQQSPKRLLSTDEVNFAA